MPSASATVQLDYSPSTDMANGTLLGLGAWADVCPAQSFGLQFNNSVVQIFVAGNVRVRDDASQSTNACTRIVVDPHGLSFTRPLGGCATNMSGGYGNALSGQGPITCTTLLGGLHAIKIQIWADSATARFYCRPMSLPNLEPLSIRVVELH